VGLGARRHGRLTPRKFAGRGTLGSVLHIRLFGGAQRRRLGAGRGGRDPSQWSGMKIEDAAAEMVGHIRRDFPRLVAPGTPA